MDTQRRQARSRLGIATKAARRDPSPAAQAELADARRDYAAVALAEEIKRVVDAWPPFTPEQLAELRDLLDPVRRRTVA